MNFGEIKSIVFIGGSEIMVDLCKRADELGFEVLVISGSRLLDEVWDGISLRKALEVAGFSYAEVENINDWEDLIDYVSEGSFGLSVGAPWIFTKEVIDIFNGKMANLQPVGIPLFDGGAHHSWQILMDCREGATLIQMIDEKLNNGPVIVSEVYALPASARIPRDFFDASRCSRLAVGQDFLERLKASADFAAFNNEERFRTFYPRLHTLSHGFIDWSWSGHEIERFICAFDEPYAGASTYIGDRKFFMKDVSFDRESSTFHPFMSGIVYRKNKSFLRISVEGGSLIVRQLFDENGGNGFDKVRLGERFYTPMEVLERAKTYSATYSANGVEED